MSNFESIYTSLQIKRLLYLFSPKYTTLRKHFYVLACLKSLKILDAGLYQVTGIQNWIMEDRLIKNSSQSFFFPPVAAYFCKLYSHN